MNTRQAIQTPTTPNVLSLSFSTSRKRFVTALSSGVRIFRSDNCLGTLEPELPTIFAASIAEALDDRYLAFVSKNKIASVGGPNVVVFWDCLLGRELTRFDFHEPVLGLRLNSKWMAVNLEERTILFQYQEIQRQALTSPPGDITVSSVGDKVQLRAPNLAHSIYPTGTNGFALASLSDDLLVLPAQTKGQVQLIGLQPGQSNNKRVLRAHNSSLRCIAVSDDSSLLATASEQGTLVRVYSTATLSSIVEFRRGIDHAVVYGLAFSPGNRFLASTSDKGTLHVFDLKPPNPAEATALARDKEAQDRRHRKSQSYASHRLSGGVAFDRDSVSGTSVGRSSPSPSTAIGGGAGTAHPGSIQEYYGLRPPPISASPPARDAAVTAMAALKASPLTPRAFRDTRSVASAPFYTGNDTLHWQGGPSHSWTTARNGTRKRVKNPVLPLPNDPSGRPPKGILAFAPNSSNDDNGATIYVIGGGSDARWEMFELLPSPASETSPAGGWGLVNRGYRKYLTRQFAD